MYWIFIAFYTNVPASTGHEVFGFGTPPTGLRHQEKRQPHAQHKDDQGRGYEELGHAPILLKTKLGTQQNQPGVFLAVGGENRKGLALGGGKEVPPNIVVREFHHEVGVEPPVESPPHFCFSPR